MPTTKKQSARATNFARYCGGDLLEFESAEQFEEWIDEGVAYSQGCEGMPTASVNIDKRCAAVLLKRNRNNRQITEGNATRFKVEIKNRSFVFSSDPIVVDVDGYMRSGQHRMMALFDSPRISLPFQICFGMTRDAALSGIDRGRPRTPNQVLRYGQLTTANSAVLRAAYFAPVVHERQLITSEWHDMAAALKEVAEFAEGVLNGATSGVKRAAVVACFARAAQLQDHDEIRRAGEILAKGGGKVDIRCKYEKNMLLLRESILQQKDAGSAEARRLLYLKTQMALDAYLRHAAITVVRISKKKTDDRFPLVGKAAQCRQKWDAEFAENQITPRSLVFLKEVANASKKEATQ